MIQRLLAGQDAVIRTARSIFRPSRTYPGAAMLGSGMSLRLVALCVDANDPLGLARFWAEALRWEVADETAEEIRLVPTDGTRFRMDFMPVRGSDPTRAMSCWLIPTATSSASHP